MKKYLKIIFIIVLAIILMAVLFWYMIYVPKEIGSTKVFYFTAERGQGDDEMAYDLEKNNVINSNYFFRLYVWLSGQHAKLKAGKYILSPGMSVYQIVNKFVKGDVIRDNITLIEGWDLTDIKKYLIEKNLCKDKDFSDILRKNQNLEGYIFPDTYEIALNENCQTVIDKAMANFEKKLTLELRAEITKQKKSIFDIVTMASIIEKEVKTQEDKKMVSGILWKRIAIGMPLQVDATINYITRKNDPGVLIIDTKIDSPYNTYKYYGLPKGPISSPGMDSILASIYPIKSPYLYYLSAKDGKTIFSKTLDEHNQAIAKYLK